MAAEKQALNRKSGGQGRQIWLWSATAVLLLAATMRLAALQQVPPGLAQDEVLNADIVTFIRQGEHALFFREGYGHEPLYHYWAVPFQVLLGDNALAIRLPAVLLGFLLVALAMRWTLRNFDMAAALAAGALLAVSWWPVIFSRIGLRPIMEPFLILIFAWFWPRRPWLAGIFLGLALYTYTGARVLFLLPLLLGLYWFLFRKHLAGERVTVAGRALPQPLLAAAVTLSLMLLLYLPLWLTLRADPTLQQRVEQLAGPLMALQTGDPRPVLASTMATLGAFSVAGDPRWTYTLPGRPLFDPLTALFFYGGLLLALWRFLRPWYAFVLFWLLVGLLPSALTPQAPSTVRLVGAMPAVYMLPALALSWTWQKVNTVSGTTWPRAAVAALLVGILLLNAGRAIYDGFIRWPQGLETRLKYQSALADIAAHLEQQPAAPLVIADGFYRPITRDSLRRMLNEDVQGRWVQTGADVAGALVLPAEGEGRLYVPEYAAPHAQLMVAAGIAGEPGYRSKRQPSFAVYTLPAESELTRLPHAVDFEGKISLVGYEITTPELGQALQMLTVWRVDGELPAGMAVFVHWLDEEGQLLSQHDGFDAAPETLRSGDLVLQRHIVPWPESLSSPLGTLCLGLYQRQDGRRLEIVGGAYAGQDSIVIPLDGSR